MATSDKADYCGRPSIYTLSLGETTGSGNIEARTDYEYGAEGNANGHFSAKFVPYLSLGKKKRGTLHSTKVVWSEKVKSLDMTFSKKKPNFFLGNGLHALSGVYGIPVYMGRLLSQKSCSALSTPVRPDSGPKAQLNHFVDIVYSPCRQ
ncbi:hypothetical protein BDP27DRAFT_1356745 [Rhodocollybia butyracea]|uniref:Uncharacterized protein n=1 Tax=Rhodocollybia butyracea TaxID=206335 RepID=A0A9P5Q9U9_9AGAR|nr:hypothetical protein BDP27DRAFT_1356745 [Rhodocollybia butyracea]